MANRTVTVKSSGGDYTSLNAALSGESGDLVGNTRLLTIETYAFEDTTKWDTGTGYTTNSSYYIKITSPESERHAGVWNSSKSRLKISGQSGATLVGGIVQENFTVVEWQQIEMASNTGSGSDIMTALISIASCTFRFNIIRQTASYSGAESDGIFVTDAYSTTPTCYIYRNIVYGFVGVSEGIGILVNGDTHATACAWYIFNNTCWENKIGISFYNIHSTQTAQIKNNYSGENTANDYYNYSSTVDASAKNISSDATSPDGASYQGKNSYSNYFYDYANKDFRLDWTWSGSNPLIRAGDDLGTTYKTSIADDYMMVDPSPTGYGGYVMTGTLWDIGAVQFPNVSQLTIKSSGGHYSSLNAALSAESNDLVALQNRIEFLTYAFEDGTDADTGTGYTVNSSYYIKITSPTSERHAGVWNSAKSRHKTTRITDGNALRIQEHYTVVEWQQVDVYPASTASAEVNGIKIYEAGDCVLRHNIVRYSGTSVLTYAQGLYIETSNASYVSYVYRNISYGFSLGSVGDDRGIVSYPGEGTNYVYNNTIFDCDQGIYFFGNQSVIFKNNFIGSCSGDCYVDGVNVTLTSSKNITSDATSPDGASYRSKTAYSDYFNDYAAKDFHLKSSDTVLKDAGDNLGSPYDIDIDGQTVSGSWDIGADEYQVSLSEGTVWGYQNPTGYTGESWSTWKTSAGGAAIVSGDADWGKLDLTTTNHYGPVKDTGNSRGKRFVIKRDSIGSGSGTVNLFIRGSITSFAAGDGSPSWESYSTPINRVWRYVQAKAEKV